MEYAAGGDLFRYAAARRGLHEDEARWFFQQLILAVDYCHRMGVTSRDIKLENTLLDGSPRPLIKLADFGFSKDANQHSAPTSRVGTPAYLAPEVVTNEPGKSYNAEKADIWSCGVLLFVMCTDRYPFRRPGDENLKPNQKLNAMLQRILKADYTFPPDKPLSKEVKDLISRILVPNPDSRPSIKEIQSHPWYLEGLNSAALSFNDTIVKESLATQPSPKVLAEVQAIVHAATRTEAAEQQQGQGQAQGDQRQLGEAERHRGAVNPTDSQSLDDFLVGAVMEDSLDML